MHEGIFTEGLIREGIESAMRVVKDVAESEPEAAGDCWGAMFVMVHHMAQIAQNISKIKAIAKEERMSLRDFIDEHAQEQIRDFFKAMSQLDPGPGNVPGSLDTANFNVDEFIKDVFGNAPGPEELEP